jgi:hypothetical protein
MPGLFGDAFDNLFGSWGSTGSGSLENQDYSPFPAGFEQSLAQRMGFTGGPDANNLLPKDPNFQSYTPVGNTSFEPTLWEKLAAGVGEDKPFDLNKTLSELGAPPTARGGATAPLRDPYQPGNPYLNIYRRSPVDPRMALKALLGGGY